MRRVASVGYAVIIGLGMVSAGCEESSPTPDPTPITIPITERFSGSLTVNGAINFPFLATAAGSVQLTLTAVGPDATTALGISLGTDNFVSCQTVLANDNATLGNQVNAQASASGRLCARIYDVGKMTGPITFEITVVHP